MTGYLPEEHVDDVETLTGDDTIGVLHFADEEDVDGGVKIDVNRLRQALISYEEEIGGDTIYLQTTHRESGLPALLLRPSENYSRAVALAGRIDPEESEENDESDEKEVVTDGGVDVQAPEAGCNCRHLAEGATCFHCAERRRHAGGILATDGGRDEWHECACCGEEYRNRSAALECCSDLLATDGGAAPMKRPESDGADRDLEQRVDELEAEVENMRQTVKDLVRIINTR